jgi:tRNA modification GTPase
MMALWPGQRTYTGGPLAEIHLTGSAPLSNLVLSDCLARGARLAEPGEFTLRAFLAGRIDLTQAEAVLGVIDAGNPAQLNAALQQLAGGISGPIGALRDRMLDLVAHLEANLDFTEEPDVDPLSRANLTLELDESVEVLHALEKKLTERERPDAHRRVVLAGPPNAGKSRLFNALLNRDRAIVSPMAGTTRDYVSELCVCDGLTVELVDTAGLDEPVDAVTTQAQAARADQSAQADLLLLCRSAEAKAVPIGVPTSSERLNVWTKGDLALPDHGSLSAEDLWITSALSGAGVPALRSAIAQTLRKREALEGSATGTGARCRGSLNRAATALRSAAESIRERRGDEFVAFDLRLAVEELGTVVGAVVTDDILDRIFRRFCVGK